MTTAEASGLIADDVAAFVAAVEPITNEVLIDDWLGLCAPDAVIEQVIDGAHERHEGTAEVAAAVTSMDRL